MPLARCLLSTLIAATACLGLPTAAGASTEQLSILQDDAVFTAATPHDSVAAMREAKELGFDAVRTNLVWQYVSPAPRSRLKPSGFEISDPSSPGYDWSPYDRVVHLANQHGLRVILSISGPFPHWASAEPRRCGLNCIWKPRADRWRSFVEAVVRRYRGRVSMYSIWNEPNLGKWLRPQRVATRFGDVDVAARSYRRLWTIAQSVIARGDPERRNRVLFGDTAAIAEPVPMLLAALCLDERGRPFRGVLRKLQGCSRRPRRLPIAGIAHHPYNRVATGSWRTRGRRAGSLSIAYLPRLHRLIRRAQRHRRIPRGRGIWVTEFGYQSRPPDPTVGLPLGRHARVLNESEYLFWRDPLVRSTAQYELYDAPRRRQFETGLRFWTGAEKPAYHATRLPLVVTRLGRNRVEIWGHVRPADGATFVDLVGRNSAGARRYARTLRTGDRGYFRRRITFPGAARLRWRVAWSRLSAAGDFEKYRSRHAKPGRRPRYSRK